MRQNAVLSIAPLLRRRRWSDWFPAGVPRRDMWEGSASSSERRYTHRALPFKALDMFMNMLIMLFEV